MTDDNKIKEIINSLHNNYYHHGYPLSRKEAKNLGIPIAKEDTNLETLLWNLYEDYADEMTFNLPYNPELMVMSKIENHMIKPNEINNLKVKNKIACLESSKMNSCIEEEINARYELKNDMSLTTNINIKPGVWEIRKD